MDFNIICLSFKCIWAVESRGSLSSYDGWGWECVDWYQKKDTLLIGWIWLKTIRHVSSYIPIFKNSFSQISGRRAEVNIPIIIVEHALLSIQSYTRLSSRISTGGDRKAMCRTLAASLHLSRPMCQRENTFLHSVSIIFIVCWNSLKATIDNDLRSHSCVAFYTCKKNRRKL